jgi:glycosyltransferase involved in cell wall biosynthesis
MIASMDEEPLVSVWMVTYNHEKYIKQSLESVLMQKTTFIFEIIIGEDCSTDGTRLIIQDLEKQFPSIIKPVYHDKNVGAMRNGYEFCAPKLRGKYVACLEGDDYWTDPHKLQKQVDFLETHPEYSISFHKATTINEVTNEVINSNPKQKSVCSIEDLFVENFICTASCTFRNGYFQDHLNFFYKHAAGDWILHIFNALHGKINFMDEVMSVYRIHEGGAIFNAISSTEKLKKALLKDIDTFKSLNKYLDFKYDHLIKNLLARVYKQLALINIQENNRKEALNHINKSFKASFKISNAAVLLPLVFSPYPKQTLKIFKKIKGQILQNLSN